MRETKAELLFAEERGAVELNIYINPVDMKCFDKFASDEAKREITTALLGAPASSADLAMAAATVLAMLEAYANGDLQ